MDFDDLLEAQRYRVTVDGDVESRGEDKRLDTEKKRFWRRGKKPEIKSPGLGPESPGLQETAIGAAI